MNPSSYTQNMVETWAFINDRIQTWSGNDAFSMRAIWDSASKIPVEIRLYSNSPRMTAHSSLEAMLAPQGVYYVGDRQAAEGYGVPLSTLKWRQREHGWYPYYRVFGKKFYTAVNGGSG